MTGVPEWLTSTFERPNEEPKEGAESTKERLDPKPLISGDKNADSTFVPLQASQPKTGPGKADIRLKGERAAQLPPEVQAQNAAIARKELAFQEAQSFTRLNTGRALSQTKAMAQEIFAEDAAKAAELNERYFSRWEKENTRLRADIDAARQLRVNPNSYRQSIGRSGRVSSVLSVAVSQLAAGAGNPNQVWNRLKSTIDQDIAAQKANIELEFAGIEAAQGQQDHEAAMLEKYYGFEEEQRAIAMSALEAQVGVIMQRAANEGEYQSYQMIRDRAQAEANAAAAAAFAKQATLFMDAPIHREYQALLKNRQFQEAQALLQQSFLDAQGPVREIDETIQSYDEYGNPVTFGAPAEGMAAEASESPVEAAPAPGSARVAKRRPSAPAPSSPEEQAVTDTTETAPAAPQRPLTPEEAQTEREDIEDITWESPRLTPDEQKEADAKREAEDKQLRVRAAAAEVEQGIVQAMGEKVIRQGGYAYANAARKGLSKESLRGLGANTFLEGRDLLLDPNNAEIAVFPSYADARMGLRYDTRTGEQAEYEKKHPELYEQYLDIEHEGTPSKPRWIESSYVETAHGKIKLRRGSSMRFNQEKREEFATKVNKDFQRIQDIRRQSEAIRKYGTGQFLGLQVGKDGLTWVGSDGAGEMNERMAGQIGMGIRAMKQLDPSGRLTDKDIEVGIQFMTALQNNPTIKVWETVSSIYRNIMGKDPTKSEVRKSLVGVFGATAKKLSDAIPIENYHHIILPWEQEKAFRQDVTKVDKWLRSDAKED